MASIHVLRLQGKNIDGDQTDCTGAQIALLLESLAQLPPLSGCQWYARSMETVDAPFTPYESGRAERIPDLKRFVERLRRTVPQLLDGSLIAIDPAHPPDFVVKVLIVESCWIEILAPDRSVLEPLRQHYGGAIGLGEPA